MSLNGAMQIGRSALLANQAAMEVAGNNLANVATPGYHRQGTVLVPVPSSLSSGVFVGRGVQIQQVKRYVDDALEGRVRNGQSNQAYSTTERDLMTQIESLQNSGSDYDLNSQLSAYFSSWSNLANNPLDNSLRSVVVQQGGALASYIQSLRTNLVDERSQTDTQIDQNTANVNDLLKQVETLNQQISTGSAGGTAAVAGLIDQRGQVLGSLAQQLDISVVQKDSGSVDVFVGSTALVLGGKSRGIEVDRSTVNGATQITLHVAADHTLINSKGGGTLGALIDCREDHVVHAIDTLDQFTGQLIYQTNLLHSQGQGTTPINAVTGTVAVTDPNAALNTAAAGLSFPPQHGSFILSVTQKSTGQRVDTQINVDLDGLNGNDTTLASLAAQINSVANVNASVTSNNQLQIAGDTGDFEISFSGDTSGSLASLGINGFFTGKDAQDIAVDPAVASDPGRVAAGLDHVAGDNGNAVALAGLRDQPIAALGGVSLTGMWNNYLENLSVGLGQAKNKADADTTVMQSLESQQQAISGVNSDEEAIDLMSYQRAYQGAARFLSTVDQMMQTLLAIT